MADSSAIGNALVAKLGADTTLLALVPNGVYFDLAPTTARRAVVVSQIMSEDTGQFGGRAFEDALFLVEAQLLSTSSGPDANATARSAAARIDALLEGGTLTVSGYTLMAMHREEFVRMTERDEVDPTILWYRRGGHYRVQMSL
jgi:hypothetical protein